VRSHVTTNSRYLPGPVADVITPAVGSAVAADRQVAELTELAFRGGGPILAPTGVGAHERAMGVGRNCGPTTDQLRAATAQLSARQRSTMDTSDRWFRLDNRGGPIWGSRGREFKSRQPDSVSPSGPPFSTSKEAAFMVSGSDVVRCGHATAGRVFSYCGARVPLRPRRRSGRHP
jgi:hypothetical protein